MKIKIFETTTYTKLIYPHFTFVVILYRFWNGNKTLVPDTRYKEYFTVPTFDCFFLVNVGKIDHTLRVCHEVVFCLEAGSHHSNLFDQHLMSFDPQKNLALLSIKY